MQAIKEQLLAIVEELDALKKKTAGLIATLEDSPAPVEEPAPEPPKKPAKKTAAKKKPAKKAVAKKPVAKKTAPKKAAPKKAAPPKAAPQKAAAPAKTAQTAKLSDSDKVVAIIKRHKNGIDVTTLKKKTGFNDKKISNIVHRASKKGKIKRSGRGIYTKA